MFAFILFIFTIILLTYDTMIKIYHADPCCFQAVKQICDTLSSLKRVVINHIC